MSINEVQLGLRLLELETGFSKNLDDSNSPEMVDYESTRLAGQTARLAMLVKGQDIIEDEQP